MSSGVTHLLALTEASGLRPHDAHTGQWSKAFVYGFMEDMPANVRDAGMSDQSLRHFSYSGDPHNRAHEGFIDERAAIAIEFSR